MVVAVVVVVVVVVVIVIVIVVVPVVVPVVVVVVLVSWPVGGLTLRPGQARKVITEKQVAKICMHDARILISVCSIIFSSFPGEFRITELIFSICLMNAK